jgi:cold-inducible RNA-binding protein
MNIYIGNLSYEASNEDLQNVFNTYGEVASANVISDRSTGRSRGFGFVEMPSWESAQAAIAGLNGTLLKGRSITVNEANPSRKSS